MKRAYTAPKDSERCQAHADTAAGNDGGQCTHRRKYGTLCQQHAARAYLEALKALQQCYEHLGWNPAKVPAYVAEDARAFLSKFGESSIAS